jgi:hypothetical protein
VAAVELVDGVLTFLAAAVELVEGVLRNRSLNAALLVAATSPTSVAIRLGVSGGVSMLLTGVGALSSSLSISISCPESSAPKDKFRSACLPGIFLTVFPLLLMVLSSFLSEISSLSLISSIETPCPEGLGLTGLAPIEDLVEAFLLDRK